MLYLTDAALENPKLDRFNRWPFAKRIADTIAARPDSSSLVVSIYGVWGEGKTSVLNFIQHELKRYPTVTCVPFNPWRCKGEDELLLDFFQTLASELGYSLKETKEQFAALLGYAARAANCIPIASGVAEEMKDAAGKWAQVPLEELKRRVEKDLHDAGKRVVVFMDDIDRLDKSEIQAVFRLVKLTAGFPNTTYVLAFDEEMVANALSERYGRNRNAGHEFLEKIVQVPLNLPPADEDVLIPMCFEHMDRALALAGIELTDDEACVIRNRFVRGFVSRIATPRMVTRYGNAITFAMPILAGEVNPVDFLLVEGMRVFYPRVYAMVRSNESILLSSLDLKEDIELRKELIDGSLVGLSKRDRASARYLVNVLFPRSEGGFLGSACSGHHWDEQWAQEKRVASSEYFTRYFKYGVPEGDISELAVAKLLDQVGNEDGHVEAADYLKQVLERVNPDKLLTRLYLRVEDLDPTSSKGLAMTVGLVGEKFPNPPAFMGYTPFSRAAGLLARLLKRLPDVQDRFTVAEHLVMNVLPLSLAGELLRWLGPASQSDPDVVLDEDMVEALRGTAAARIEAYCKTHNLCKDYPREAPLLLYIWANQRGRTRTNYYLKRLFKKDPRAAEELLMGYVGTTVGGDAVVRPGSFERHAYDSVCKVVDPAPVLVALRGLYGKTLDSPDPSDFTKRPVAERIAHQFAHVHLTTVKPDAQDATGG